MRTTPRNKTALPDYVALTEAMTLAFRSALDAVGGMSDYVIYAPDNSPSHIRLDVEATLRDLASAASAAGSTGWQPLPPLAGGLALQAIVDNDDQIDHAPTGLLPLPHLGVAIARWSFVLISAHYGNAVRSRVTLVAARSVDDYRAFQKMLDREERQTASWMTIISSGHTQRSPREAPGTLLIPEAVRRRVFADIVQFFDPAVAEVYRKLAAPLRRGVLLHGPPGNGKTSLIRWIATLLPDVAAINVRSGATFDTDDLTAAIETWTRQAPAMLVLEDIDTLINQVNLSTFLNLIDGIDRRCDGGLLLIGTTNHPEKLDPAVNNRPGRFDVVMEVPLPDASLRRQYLASMMPDMPADLIAGAAQDADGLSFAHLKEIVYASALAAIHAGRTDRTPDDLRQAVAQVAHSARAAGEMFRPVPAFGLHHLHRRQSEQP